MAEQSALVRQGSPICFGDVVQVPLVHSWPVPHWAQVEPMAPHENWVLPGAQKPFWQQPAQLIELQVGARHQIMTLHGQRFVN